MTVYFGDCRESMCDMIGQGIKVQTCVTSPPYFGLRDYGHPEQLGLEPTPEEYVANLVTVFRLVRELLADDGVLWLNLGDSYNAAGRTGHGTRQGVKQGTNRASDTGADNCRPSVGSLKEKDLIGIPWRVALALQADGWYLRQDIIWHKPNPMPESVTDRCTKSHEYLFMLTKNARYYFDSDAIKEPVAESTIKRVSQPNLANQVGSDRVPGKTNGNMKAVGGRPGGKKPDKFDSFISGAGRSGVGEGLDTRNKRSVWTISTKPYKGAHFATFPPELVEPCILAGSRLGDLVFDPFLGSGTVAMVAARHGRRWVGCELNEEYGPLQEERLAKAK
jgi:DNA modification methylase